jgi:hypothetical protein
MIMIMIIIIIIITIIILTEQRSLTDDGSRVQNS